jgi:hypothetical protein
MKNNILLIFSILFINSFVSLAQENTYEKIKQEYEAFQYAKVIEFSTNFAALANISDSLKIDIYLMRSVSFYSIGKEDSTRNNFLEILYLKNDYNPDPAKISPKLISIFNSVKSDFIKTHSPQIEQVNSTDHQAILDGINPAFKYSLLQNFIAPGWGQIKNGNLTKGITLAALSTANLAAMIYFISDTNKKEHDYLIETDRNLFQQKYDSFNSSFKTRNVLIVSYVIIWLYSQLDLLFISGSNSSGNNFSSTAGLIFEISTTNRIHLSYKVPINF